MLLCDCELKRKLWKALLIKEELHPNWNWASCVLPEDFQHYFEINMIFLKQIVWETQKLH